MKYRLVKFKDGTYGARRYSWAPLFGGYKFLDVYYPQIENNEWALPLVHCKGTRAVVEAAMLKEQTKLVAPEKDLGTPC